MKSKVVIIVLSILVVGLGGYIVYDKVKYGNRECQVNVSAMHSNKSLRGKYTGHYGQNNEYELYLNDDGTFVYEIEEGELEYDYVGNYTIVDNRKINLNCLFKVEDKKGSVTVRDKITVRIDNNKTLVVNDSTGGFTLKKESNEGNDDVYEFLKR